MPVLLIEDDTALRSLISTLLSRIALAAETASRGEVAVGLLATRDYDAIILDLLLPGMNGFEVLEHVYRNRPSLLPRIIVVTALSEGDLARRFRFEGLIWKLLRKPFDIDEFSAAVVACSRCHARPAPLQNELSAWLQEESAAAGALVGTAAVIGRDGELRLVGACGAAAEGGDAFFPLPIRTEFPICTAARNGKPLWIGSAESSKPESGMFPPLWSRKKYGAIAAMPLKRDGHVLGAIAWAFADAQSFDVNQREQLLVIAERCAPLIANAELGSGGHRAESRRRCGM